MRRKLSTNPEILEGKKVVIWEFAEREMALGQEGWARVTYGTRHENERFLAALDEGLA